MRQRRASPASGLGEEAEPYDLQFSGPVDLPFDHDDVRVYIDNLFTDGLLVPTSGVSRALVADLDGCRRGGVRRRRPSSTLPKTPATLDSVKPSATSDYKAWFTAMPKIPLPDVGVGFDLDGPGQNTRFAYLYRDADNYKQGKEVILQGRLSRANIAGILRAASDYNHFIPGDVGMENLQPRFNSGWEIEADHPWHEIVEIAYVDDPPTSDDCQDVMTVVDLVAKWPTTQEDWDFMGAEERLIEAMGLSEGSRKKYGAAD